MILCGCRSGLVVWGTGSCGDNQGLAGLGVSYRTHFLSLVSILSNMGVLRFWENNEKPAVTCCLLASGSVLSTHLLNLYALSMRKPGNDWQAHHKFGCCPPLWPLSGLHHPAPVDGHCRVYHKGQISQPELLGLQKFKVFDDLMWLWTISP